MSDIGARLRAGFRPGGVARYVLARLLQGIVVVIGAVTITFVLFSLIGDPVDAQPNAYLLTEEQRADLRAEFGLDEPVYERYVQTLADAAHFDFGHVAATGEKVSSVVAKALPYTVFLLGSAVILAVIVAVPLAVWSVLHADRRAERATRVGLGVLQAIPEFWLGLILILVFSLSLGLLPGYGYTSPASVILPALTLAVPVVPALVRFMRNQLLDVLSQDFVTALEARGFSRRYIVLRHGLLNVLVPTSSFFALQLGWMLGGSIIVEQVFAWPGIGTLTVSSVEIRELSVVQGIVIVVAVGYVIANLLADLVALLVDPRTTRERV
jgi:ABC-type dipeptide/oligopeptide/nickel transport system permease component